MSEYKSIKGKTVQFLGTDPSETSTEGQVWYNSAAGAFKSVVSSAAWSTGAPLTSGPRSDLVGAGTQTAALAAAGRNNSPGTTTQFSNTDEYNGSGWSAGGSMGTARHNITGTGLQTAALGVGGYIEGSGVQSATEEYDGSSWTAGGALPTAKFAVGLAGIQTAAVAAGGRTPSFTNTTEEYNGTSWTAVNNMNTSRTLKAAMTGSETAAVAFGGDVPPSTANVEEYDGTTWTEVNNLPAANQAGGASGPQTSALFFGGTAPAVTTNAFTYDGTNFSATGSLGTAVQSMGTASNAASNSTGLSFGGYGASTYLNNTEEFNVSINVITGAAWASGGNLNNATRAGAGIGTRDAAIAAGGITGSPAPAGPGRPGLSEEYNGTSWTNLPTIGRSPSDSAFALGGCGTATAGLIAGGMPGAQGQVANSDEWDGSSWTVGGAMNDARQSPELAGIQTQALVTGGRDDPGPVKSTSEIYNGTSWTTDASMSNTRTYHGSGGTTSAAWAGGSSPSGTSTTATENYDGTSWTASGALVAGTYGAGHGGPQTSGHIAGGGSPYLNTTQHYDGTIWVTAPSISSARRNVFSSPNVADTSTAMIAGGTPAPTNVQSTEEFTGETSALNLKTLTTS